jgi:hypothetical protein
LLDCRPNYLIETEHTLDPLLAHHLVLAGVIHCLPFLARWVNSTQALENVTDTMLKEVRFYVIFIKLYKTIIVPVLYGCETWSLIKGRA